MKSLEQLKREFERNKRKALGQHDPRARESARRAIQKRNMMHPYTDFESMAISDEEFNAMMEALIEITQTNDLYEMQRYILSMP